MNLPDLGRHTISPRTAVQPVSGERCELTNRLIRFFGINRTLHAVDSSNLGQAPRLKEVPGSIMYGNCGGKSSSSRKHDIGQASSVIDSDLPGGLALRSDLCLQSRVV